jgi:hypothetical protein
MTKKRVFICAILSTALFCGGAVLAQEPVQNINKQQHPNLAEAQRLVAEANKRITDAQVINHEDMGGHAEKARHLLVQVNEELKRAAEAANAAGASQKKK